MLAMSVSESLVIIFKSIKSFFQGLTSADDSSCDIHPLISLESLPYWFRELTAFFFYFSEGRDIWVSKADRHIVIVFREIIQDCAGATCLMLHGNLLAVGTEAGTSCDCRVEHKA